MWKPYVLFISVFWISSLEAFLEQVWATIERPSLDLCLLCHLSPGVISHCKVWKGLPLSSSELWLHGWTGIGNMEVKKTQLARRQNKNCWQLWNDDYVPATVLYILYTFNLLIPQLYREVRSIIIPILQVRKLRHRVGSLQPKPQGQDSSPRRRSSPRG